ncbi:hypothetical protein KHC28_17315 [Ancylobacter sonchi]|uniref:DUF6270 domain-containing protein n=1 Tax=Ancylobacter sonchi TaxID=1937790 RepID=UPI001BD29BB4|nr:DUF6270 domain-containing protein [Ancylobacter sonchi]MBS7535415.1 hypothetical protein [Ancylobacter sonchi]
MTVAAIPGSTRIKSVAILGTCVSRDMIRIAAGDTVQVKKYLARGTVRSALAHSPAKLSYGDPADLSGFERRNFETDVAKSAFKQLGTAEVDICIVDMIDERLSTWSAGDAVLVNSKGLEALMGKLPPPWKLHRPPSVRDETLKQAPLWAAQLKKAVGDTPIVIHRAVWAYGADVGEAAVDDQNLFLNQLYDIICAALPDACVVSADASVQRAAQEHQWGAAPFHYIDAYYVDVWSKISAAFPDNAG